MNEQEKALKRAYQAAYMRQWRKREGSAEKTKDYNNKYYLRRAMEAQEEWNEAFKGGTDNAN